MTPGRWTFLQPMLPTSFRFPTSLHKFFIEVWRHRSQVVDLDVASFTKLDSWHPHASTALS